MDFVLFVSVVLCICFLVVFDGIFVFFFYFIVLLILKVLDDDLIKVVMVVVWNSCFCVNWNGIEWFGILWIKVFLLKKIVFVGDIERLEILIGCCMFFFIDEYLVFWFNFFFVYNFYSFVLVFWNLKFYIKVLVCWLVFLYLCDILNIIDEIYMEKRRCLNENCILLWWSLEN